MEMWEVASLQLLQYFYAAKRSLEWLWGGTKPCGVSQAPIAETWTMLCGVCRTVRVKFLSPSVHLHCVKSKIGLVRTVYTHRI
jgi:hypothetical protein